MSLTLVAPMAPAFTVVDAAQRSPAWRIARLGRLTGSRAGDMMSTTKSGEASASRRDLRTQLVLERLTGTPGDEGYVSPEMRRAVAVEPHAVAAYEARTGHLVHRTGFLAHDTLAVGCSLDGHVGAMAGILEVKCPKSATHLKYLTAGTVPLDHLPQIVHNLWVSGAAWCDFLSFDDRFPPHLQTFLVRYHRHAEEIATYATVVGLFLAEVDAEYARVNGLRQAAA
jgi:hypothetical protein